MTSSTLAKVEEKRIAKSQDQSKYKSLKAEVQKLVRQDKRAYTESLCEDIENGMKTGNSRKLYGIVKKVTGKFQPKLNMIKSASGENIVDPDKIADRWREYTEGLYSETGTTPAHIPSYEKEPPPLKSEVEKAMNDLNTNKAPGPDGIPIELLKAGGPETLNAMHQICTGIWETGDWPEEWVSSTFIPIPKKGDLSQCTNYRTISLVSHASKVLLKIILNRIQAKTEQEIAPEQAGFRPGRGTREQITNLRIIMAKLKEHNQPLYMCFIDFQKAFDSVRHEQLWWTMLDMGYPPHLVSLLSKLYKGQKAAVRIAGVVSDWFKIGKGVRQGCVLSPTLFNIVSEMVMRKALENFRGGILIGGRRISNLRYADDIVLLASSVQELQELLDRITTAGLEYNLHMNVDKTKVMSLDGEPLRITINGAPLEQVKKFPYLGSTIAEDATCSEDIRRRIGMGNAVLTGLKSLWQSHTLSIDSKIKLCKALAWSVATYGCESWIIRQEESKKIQAFEMKMLRKVLRIPWTARRTNESILQDTGYKRVLLGNIKKRKLTYLGHIMRKQGDNLEKTIIQGAVPGKRGRGRPRKTWIDDATEWTGMGLEQMMKATSDRIKWRRIVYTAANP